MNDSPPALLRGKEWRCPRHLLRSSSFPHLRVCLCQGRFIASLDDIGASWNTGGAALLQEARHTGLRFSTGRNSSGGHRRAPTATSRLGLALRRSGASRRGKMLLDSLGLLLYCRELLGTVLDSVAEQSSLGDESVEKAHFVDIAPLSKAEP